MGAVFAVLAVLAVHIAVGGRARGACCSGGRRGRPGGSRGARPGYPRRRRRAPGAAPAGRAAPPLKWPRGRGGRRGLSSRLPFSASIATSRPFTTILSRVNRRPCAPSPVRYVTKPHVALQPHVLDRAKTSPAQGAGPCRRARLWAQ